LDSKQSQPGTFSSQTLNDRVESPTDARILQALQRLNSELANAHRELARKNADLDKAVQEKNQMLGMAAHDLRNPLGNIVGVVDMLIEEIGGTVSEENRELLIRVASSAEYMQSLIDDMLDYAKVNAGRLELQLQSVDIAELVRDNLEFNAILASKKGSHLRFEDDAPPLLLQLDSRRIQQVLNNLISNALKFSAAGSTITVSVRRAPDEVTIAVADQGQGIAPDEIGKLFKPFSVTRTKSTANERSTGLGLAIVRRIVEAHGGRIGVESRLGQGSTFFVSLPISSSENSHCATRS
jgi:signal transduction histidine kinase